MARIGLKNFRYSLLDESDKVIEPKSLGKAIDCKVSLNYAEGKLFADDGLVESENIITGGTATISIDEDDDTVFAEILGHTITEGEMVRKTTDVAPYIAFGRILTKVVNGSYKYKVEFLSKVKFKEALPDEKTKGESIEYGTVSIEGTVHIKTNGEWSKTKTFTTYEQASEYLDSLLTATA